MGDLEFEPLSSQQERIGVCHYYLPAGPGDCWFVVQVLREVYKGFRLRLSAHVDEKDVSGLEILAKSVFQPEMGVQLLFVDWFYHAEDFQTL